MPKSIFSPLRPPFQAYLHWIYNSSVDDRLRWIQENMTPDPQARLLDCGCRDGEGTMIIAERIGTRNVSGLDYTYRVLKQSRDRGITVLCSNLNNPIPIKSNTYDAIYAINLVEHLIDPALFIQEIYRILRPGGYFLLDTPNLASWHNVFALLIGRQPFSGPNLTNMEDAELTVVRELHRNAHGLPKDGPLPEHGEQELTRHIVVIAYRSMLDLVRAKGFQIQIARGFGYYPLPPFLARLFERIDPAHAHHICLRLVKPAR
jgi:SAM-dependent methyltransferase